MRVRTYTKCAIRITETFTQINDDDGDDSGDGGGVVVDLRCVACVMHLDVRVRDVQCDHISYCSLDCSAALGRCISVIIPGAA